MDNYILVAVASGNEEEVANSLDELGALLETAGGCGVGEVIQNLPHPDPATYIGSGKGHCMPCFTAGEEFTLTVPEPKAQLAAGTLQTFLDAYIEKTGCAIDYVHGDEEAKALGRQPGNMAVLLPAMQKSELFPTVINDGVLPRKTFSMGHARDKRYYIESRKIK